MTPEAIRTLLEERLANAGPARGEKGTRRVSIELDAADVTEAVLVALRGDKSRFVTIVAVDTGLEIELLYNISVDGVLLTLRTSVAKEAGAIETITTVAPAAECVEKEIAELFGVEFVGHARRMNLVLPDDWPSGKRPMRKPLVGDLIPQARASVENLMIGGTSIRVGPSSAVKREKAGLPRMPPLASANPDRMQEVKDLLTRSGFDKRAGFDRRTGKLRYK
jgi:Ni,Fe-hydrogenase III component G